MRQRRGVRGLPDGSKKIWTNSTTNDMLLIDLLSRIKLYGSINNTRLVFVLKKQLRAIPLYRNDKRNKIDSQQGKKQGEYNLIEMLSEALILSLDPSKLNYVPKRRSVRELSPIRTMKVP